MTAGLPLLEIFVPVLDEERALSASVARIRSFARERLAGYRVRITVVDNGSTDRTPAVARQLADRADDVGWLRLEQPGRGRALRHAWGRSEADVLVYTDVDLSADLAALPEMLRRIRDGADVAIGSRHLPDSRVTRSALRGLLSRGYNLLVRGLFGAGFSDAQCGFKAITRSAARALVPRVRDDAWFFDTELLLLAERLGYTVEEVGLRWVEDRDSRVLIVATVLADLRGLARLRLGGLDRAVREARHGDGGRRGPD